ncbi:hypothetical protein I9018_31335 [Pseudomonas sp. MPFS]|uniref:hypothetical protein n=1 Tax=Pseudomonas sp. MPFS TaxID=2795724 RepID=UPI001F141C8E|nr:hypothetical protein [Pseudomonas sp. MPFS]UMZ11908.1 hypothetical protein I9018_31335 [Pseudomonas sp. MPFS]
MRVLILDDETPRATVWKKSLDALVGGEVVVYDAGQVSNLIGELHRARFNSRNGDYKPASSLEGYDLIIVDYDLLGLEMERPAAWATGAELAYSIRLMSTVGPIVVVNQFGTNAFDLTMRRGISSYADLDVGSAQITASGLWSSDGFAGFRPWHWPNLHEEVTRFENLNAFVLKHLDSPVLSVLNFELEDSDAWNFISYEMVSFLGVGQQKKETTFREMVKGNAGLRVFNILEKDEKLISSLPDEQAARIAAAILIHWLEKVVLPSQEVIADVPHLSMQLPWIVEDFSNPQAWADLCSLGDAHIPKFLIPYKVEPECLFSRPTFWAERARRDSQFPDKFEFSKLPNIQFCEDVSRFVPEDQASSFPSDVIAFDKKRWVEIPKSSGTSTVNYEPQSYLLM